MQLPIRNFTSSSSEVDDTDEDKDYYPDSPKKSFIKNLNEISPLPSRSLFSTTSENRGQSRRGRGRPKLGPQKTVVITSSPYKQELEKARNEKKRRQKKKENRKENLKKKK